MNQDAQLFEKTESPQHAENLPELQQLEHTRKRQGTPFAIKKERHDLVKPALHNQYEIEYVPAIVFIPEEIQSMVSQLERKLEATPQKYKYKCK